MNELPAMVLVRRWMVVDKFTEEWTKAFSKDNMHLQRVREGSRNVTYALQRLLDLNEPMLTADAKNSLVSSILWLETLANDMFDLRTGYCNRVDTVEGEMIPAIRGLVDEREALRKLYEPIIEKAHEDRERAEYYKSLLDDHNIEY